MTVVCFRAGVLAADRQVTSPEDLIVGEVTKIQNIGGWLAGGSGFSSDLTSFFQWILDDMPKEKPDLSDDFEGLLISPDGKVRRYGKDLVDARTVAPYHAIGGGDGVALGAMAAGKTAEQAVKIASKLVLGCGGGIDVLRLAPPEPSSPAAATP